MNTYKLQVDTRWHLPLNLDQRRARAADAAMTRLATHAHHRGLVVIDMILDDEGWWCMTVVGGGVRTELECYRGEALLDEGAAVWEDIMGQELPIEE